MRKKILGLASFAFVASLSVGAFVLKADMVSVNASETATFAMVEGAQVRTANPSGIRFVTDVNEAYKAELSATYPTESYNWVWGTTLTFVDVEQNSWTVDAKTKKWIDNDTRWYTALVEIPGTDYLTEITAESYVKIYDLEGGLVDTKTVENAQTRSIAWTASWALNDGYTDEILYTYTKAITDASVILDKEGAAYVAPGREFTLTATVQPAGYGIAWRSSDPTVATVDKNGKVTTLKKGEATITATLGNATDSYQVNVKNASEANVGENKLITKVMKNSDGSGTTFGVNYGVIYGRDENTKAYGVELPESNNSGTMYISLSKDVIADWFDNNNASAITFDIILSEAKQLQLNGNNANFYNGGYYTVTTETVDGVTYYTYHVRITKEYYEANKTKAFAFRYTGHPTNIPGTTSLKSLFFYIDNLVVEATV